MLDEAFGLMPSAKLERLVGGYLRVEDLRPDEAGRKLDSARRLRGAVEEFDTASRRGDYYEPFAVDSRNCSEQSNGTTAWIAECNRLLDRCVALSSRRHGVADVVASFEMLFDLIDVVDTFEDDIIFFADEGGAYEIGVGWGTVMEAWFGCFARHAAREGSYDRRVAAILERGNQCAGEARRRMAPTVQNRKPPPASGR
jgi:hypothetical protein